MAPTIGRLALDNGFHGSIPEDWVAPTPQNIQFSAAESDAANRVFMDLDELCGTIVSETAEKAGTIEDSRPAAMERLVHELISDRLMMLSRYITLDSSSRTIMIDQSSLSADGYRIVTH